MFGLAFRKIIHKKWMNLSLLVGCVLLIGVMVSFPVYRDASYERMLQDEFGNELAKEAKWPATVSSDVYFEMNKDGGLQDLEQAYADMPDTLGVPEDSHVFYYSISRTDAVTKLGRADAEGMYLSLGAMNGLPEHITMIGGEGLSESGLAEDGAIEVIVPRNTLVYTGLLVGEEVELPKLTLEDGSPVTLLIKGVFDISDSSDMYWQQDITKDSDAIFMDYDLFREYFSSYPEDYRIQVYFYELLKYSDIRYSDVKPLAQKTRALIEDKTYKGRFEEPGFLTILDTYARKINRISATLTILQIPILVLLCAFLLMISGQMYEMEKNEISVIKSRGSSRAQIFRLYLWQSGIITLAGALIGVPLGMLFARVLGSTRSFLDFSMNESLTVSFGMSAVLYTAAACLLCIASLTVPAIRHSRVSIVNLKQSRAAAKKPFWQKLYLDVILILISGYGYYRFNHSSAQMAESVLQGESLDPLLYISSSLFILGFGLLFLRLQPYLILLIFKIGEKKWRPASYISFTENIRNTGKLQLIMLFLIMTVSLGIYHSAVARTIVDNAVENTEYLQGSDVILQEVWTRAVDASGTSSEYIEPNFTKYQTMEIASGVNKVIHTEEAYISTGKSSQTPVCLMGINTKNFGEHTSIAEGLNAKTYYEYLNELAVEKKGIIVSSNFQSELGYEIGDSLTFCLSKSKQCTGTIVDFVDYWPGFSPTVTGLNPDGTAYTESSYLIVTHYDRLRKTWGAYPYEVWIDLKDDFSAADMYQWVEDNNVHLTKYETMETAVEDTIEDPLLQGTNGILTLGFVVTILLCAIGYLIYWVMAIKERELMFGVLRASGFHKGELVHLLINEQIFSGFMSAVAGAVIGICTAKMFVPILQQAYASEDQALPMHLISKAADMYRICAVTAGAMLLSLLVLVVIMFRMNVTKALKLGEE